MTLVNEGTIIASGSHALDIDTGANPSGRQQRHARGCRGSWAAFWCMGTSPIPACCRLDGGALTIDGNVSGSGSRP